MTLYLKIRLNCLNYVKDSFSGLWVHQGLLLRPTTAFSSWGQEDPLKKEWQLIPIVLPGAFPGQRNRVGYSPWGGYESDTPEWLTVAPFKIKNAASVLILVGWPIAPHFIFSSKGCCSKAGVYYTWLISCLNGNKNGKAGWCVRVAVTCVLAGAENLLGRQIITFSPLNHWSLSL